MSKHLSDVHQNAWQLASIQLVSLTNLPVFITSFIISSAVGFYNGLLILLLGNIVLFFMRWAIVSLSHEGRKSAIDLARDYLGKYGRYVFSLVILLANFVWFIKITSLGSLSIRTLLPINGHSEVDIIFKYSVLIGLASTFFCIKGIKWIKGASLVFFPIMLVCILVITFVLQGQSVIDTRQIDFMLPLSYLPMYLGIHLGATSDLPTFFRHSNSIKSSIKALVVIQLISFLIGICSLYFGAIISPESGLVKDYFLNSGLFFGISIFLLVILSTIGTNFANIYSASVGWELLVELLPKNKISKLLVGPQEWLILGLGSIILFVFFFDSPHIDLLLELVDNSLVNFCIVIFAVYLFQLILEGFRSNLAKPISSIKKIGLFLSWACASIVNSFQVNGLLLPHYSTLVVGGFIVFIFVAIFELVELKVQNI